MSASDAFTSFAPYYDLLYADKDYAGEARWIGEQPVLYGCAGIGAQILDLGCGTGQHMIELQKLGYSVRGVDSSRAMINLALAKGLSVEVANVRNYTDPASVHYDAVIALFHVASYQLALGHLIALFNTARLHLKKGGIFIFDFWYGPAVLTHPPVTSVKKQSNAQRIVSRLGEPLLVPEENEVQVEYLLLVSDVDGHRDQTLTETHRLRYWFLPELRHALRAGNFEILSEHVALDRYDGKIVARCV